MTKKPFIKQEVFDYVLKFLRKQGESSMTVNGPGQTCAYRGDNGKMCAVGCLIPDSIMNQHMGLNHAPVRDCGVKGMLREIYSDIDADDDNIQLLSALQETHDGYLDRELDMFNSEMKMIAEAYELVYTEPK